MRLRTVLATLLLTAVPLGGQPAAAAAPVTIAYARWTQTWELVLTNGAVVKVPEALAVAPPDAVNPGVRAAFLVSGDGRHFFYFRKSDGRFAERTPHGREHVIRKLTVYTTGEEWPSVSYDGGFVVTETSAPGLGALIDLRKGKSLPLPGKTDMWSFAGFSPDGERLLMQGGEDGRMTVFDRGLRICLRSKTRLWATALANDHVTAAEPLGSWPKSRKLRLVDLRTGKASGTVTVRLPRGQQIDDLGFDKAGHLIVRSKTKTGVTVYRVSKTTGAVTPLRTLVRPDAKIWVLPGDDEYEPWTEKK
ncbi:WD40 repeat domain-containing protein [Microbispora hainanensis]|uniref:WD40 repeat domain-containing protein n=1 Tax=Microbispora hainanensis TaxID=568844 RepID=A0A544YU41_9ACTN|nr:WD40 repeat domain-containing protein [Microbispora hainanensis]TQS20269.1 WD40 repeat domain-containing protein [Microbispora hainanensis]